MKSAAKANDGRAHACLMTLSYRQSGLRHCADITPQVKFCLRQQRPQAVGQGVGAWARIWYHIYKIYFLSSFKWVSPVCYGKS